MPLDQPAVASDIATIAPPSTEVGALALTTMKPEDYAAAVFKPFNDKLAVECAAADLIVFSEAQLLALPEDARKLAQVVDITTTAGMAVAVKYRAIFRDDIRLDSKEAFEVRKAPVLHIGRLLDAGKKKIADAVAPYEAKFNDAIKAEETRKANEKAEKERVEAARVAEIRAKITDIRTLPARNTGSNSATLYAVLAVLASRPIEAAEFAELVNEARAAVSAAGPELNAMYAAAQAAEQAEADRLAELAAEKKRNAEQAEANRLAAIENERIANEQAATARRLADQQAAQERDARERAEKAAANLKAEQDALAEQVRRTNEAQAEAAAKVEAAQAALEAQKAEFAAAVKMDADHAEALIDNATFDDAMTRLAAVDTPTFAEPSADLARCTATAQAMLTNGRSLVQAGASLAAYVDAGLADADDPSDEEIIEQVAESFGMTFAEALARVSTIAFAELRAELVAA